MKKKTMAVVLEHGRHFLLERLAPAEPLIAQHATACYCRGCLAKWHAIPKGQPLLGQEVDYLLDILDSGQSVA